MPTRLVIFLFVLAAFLFPWQPAGTYPIDGYDQTEISRLKRLQDMDSAAILRLLPYGSRHALEYVRLNLMEHPVLDLPDTDRALQDELEKVLPIFHPSYSLAVYDMTPGKERYAERNPNRGYQPGSVGKLAVATALFCELENLYLDDLEARSEILKNRIVRAGPFGVYDEHTIPRYEVANSRYSRSVVNEKDEFSLYEWVDHMLSVSNNGAASIVWREAILMRVFGQEYPNLTHEQMMDYFQNTPYQEKKRPCRRRHQWSPAGHGH
jgi:hypothetical protein